jgi:predicted flap endonuclease-1-like 5' DNA nuclease
VGYLITQALLCLLLAAAIGLVVGWLIRRFICQKQAQALEAGWSARLSRVETQRDELAARVAQLERSIAGAGQATSAPSASAHQPATLRRASLVPGAEKPRLLSGPKGNPDDLKQISGIGPKLERTLNELGVYHFHQIAQFTASNVAWVDEHLRSKGRIRREGWVEQAVELAAGRPTEFSHRYLPRTGK